jgi:S-DNA-T family DNA segregation ATPase FtsK/SpoIIIE
MLLGIWPELGLDWADALNIRGLPGGVVGQRLCAPDWGLMRAILNASGSALISLAFVTVGLGVVWVHDWHDLAWPMLRACFRSAAEPETEASAARRAEDSGADTAGRRSPEVAGPTASEPPREAEPHPAPGATVAAPARTPSPAVTPAAPATPVRTPPAKRRSDYVPPGTELLNADAGEAVFGDPAEVDHKKKVLQDTLDSFGIDAQVGQATCGPRVTLYEVIPAPGVKVERISRLSNNICMDLRATSIRILTPIPGRKSVGIEVPNSKVSRVSVRSLMDASAWKSCKARIPLLVGRSISGDVVILDLEKAPHLLIAGATGSGKSVCINLMILSLLYRFAPEDLRLIMVDPKVVEFRAYQSLPHLITPVISKVEQVPLALRWVIREMEWRYRVLAKVAARNLESFNARPKSKEVVLDDHGEPIPARLPYVVVVIDELADIMMTAKGDVETALARLAQMSRAVGIHAILATQRPSVNVITGIIKANFPTRIAFKVTSQVDSRTILDCKGAEALLGQGDMLFRPPGAAGLQRNQGGMVEDEEIERVVGHVAGQGEQEFDPTVLRPVAEAGLAGEAGQAMEEADEALVQQAMEIIIRDRRATTSYLQRAMRIGYNRAASIIDILEQRGVIGPQIGSAPREILVAGAGQPPGPSAPDEDSQDEDADEEDDGPRSRGG